MNIVYLCQKVMNYPLTKHHQSQIKISSLKYYISKYSKTACHIKYNKNKSQEAIQINFQSLLVEIIFQTPIIQILNDIIYSIDSAMQKLHLKELEELKKEQEIKQLQYKKLLAQTINSEQQLKEIFLFIKDMYEDLLQRRHNSQSHFNVTKADIQQSDFTPSSISKLVFDQHLNQIKSQFGRLPDGQAKVQHFLLIMMKVLFINPSRTVKKQKEQQILRNMVKQQNKRQGIKGMSPLKVPNKRKPPSLLSSTKQRTKPSTQFPYEAISRTFDKYPYFVIALHSMFKQMVQLSQSTIKFSQLQKFIMGELVQMKNQTSSTQFRTQFQENKKQDFLLHDNGIKRLIRCHSLNLYLCLDYKQHTVKIYNSQLKNKHDFQPNRMKHNRKSPEIIDMFYTDFGNSLGLVLSNKSIQIVNFEAYLNKPYQKQFLPFAMNQIVVRFQEPIRSIVYIQMSNKWLAVGAKNQLMLVDVSKYRSRDEQVTVSNVRNGKSELLITLVLQVVQLSMVCVVAGNQVWFYDEKLSKRKFHSYVHEQDIALFKYYEERNAFYLCGAKEKTVTVLKPARGRQSMQITQLPSSRPILQFQLFPNFNSILFIDDKHTLRLVSEQTKQVYQVQEYTKIVRQQQSNQNQQQNRTINILKLSREQFTIYQSYMVSLNLAKVAIQTQIQFQFLPYCYFDQQKQDIYVSFNNQIFGISLLQGQIRQTFTYENSNIQALQFFFVSSKKYKPFVVDLQNKVFDLYSKQMDGNAQNQNKKYKKKLEIKEVQLFVFDQQIARCLFISSQRLYQLKNEGHNAFSTINITNFSNLQIISSVYVKQRRSFILNCLSLNTDINSSSTVLKSISSHKSSKKSSSTLFQSGQQQIFKQQPFILQVNINQLSEYKIHKYIFKKIKEDDKPEVILRCVYIQDYQVQILLTDQNVVYIVDGKQSKQNNQKQNSLKREFICIKVYHFLSPKVRDLLKFNQAYSNSIKVKEVSNNSQGVKNKKTSMYYSLFLTSQEGFFIQIKLNNILARNFSKSMQVKGIQKPSLNSLSQLYQIDYMKTCSTCIECIQLSKESPHAFNNLQGQFSLVKAHNACKIQIIKKLQLQFLLTLSIGKEGYLKLWNENKQCVVSLKFPTLRKQVFDVKHIQDVRTKRMVQDALVVVKNITSNIQAKQRLKDLLHMTRSHQFDKEYEKVDQKQPIKIDIQNKFVEQIVYQQPTYHATIDQTMLLKRYKKIFAQKHNQAIQKPRHSLKKERSFQALLEKSQLKQKNSISIPSQIFDLRKSLRKYEKRHNYETLKIPSLSESGYSLNSTGEKYLLFLPKLNEYKMETSYGGNGFMSQRKSVDSKRYVSIIDSEDDDYDGFQSCVFVKNKISRKKGNDLDRIDKQFIRKEYSLLAKKHLAKKKDVVQILNNKVPQQQRQQADQISNTNTNLQTIIKEVRRLRYQSKYGGQRHIPKVKFTSPSELS